MKPQHVKNSVSRLIVLKLCLLMVLMLFSSVHARPSETQGAPFAFRGGKRGQNAYLGGTRDAKIASKTFSGIAEAMASQWGIL